MEGVFINVAREALIVIVLVSAPPILAAVAVGLTVSVFQALTQIQEPTVGIFGKMLAVFGTLYVMGHWMLQHVSRLGRLIFTEFPNWVK